MSLSERREHFIQIWERYQKANKREKGQILDKYCQVCGYVRNYAIRKLKQDLNTPRHRSGRKATYDRQFILVLVRLWKAMYRCCSKKMVAALPH
jgi:hypothetical protein